MSEIRRSIEVFTDWVGLDGPQRLGILLAHETRGKELFSFEYDGDWLARHDGRVLDPELRLYRGAQYV